MAQTATDQGASRGFPGCCKACKGQRASRDKEHIKGHKLGLVMNKTVCITNARAPDSMEIKEDTEFAPDH